MGKALSGELSCSCDRSCFTSGEYDLSYFSVANRVCFDNLGLNQSVYSLFCEKKNNKKQPDT